MLRRTGRVLPAVAALVLAVVAIWLVVRSDTPAATPEPTQDRLSPAAEAEYPVVPLAALTDARVVEDTLLGQRVLSVTSTRPVTGPRPVALMLHGAGHDHRVPVEQAAQQFTQELIDAGWIVAASDAGGDAWGAPPSQRAYLDLLDHLRSQYPVDGVVLVSMSMGGVAGLNLVADRAVPDLLGWVGITAVTNLRAMAADPRFTGYVEAALDDAQVARLDPLTLPAQRLAGVPLIAIASPADPWTPPGEQLTPFVAHMSDVNPVQVLECRDGHVGVDCYRADVVRSLAGRLAHRRPRPAVYLAG